MKSLRAIIELYKRSISIADFISTNKYKKVAILGYRSVNVYAVILAAIFAKVTSSWIIFARLTSESAPWKQK